MDIHTINFRINNFGKILKERFLGIIILIIKYTNELSVKDCLVKKNGFLCQAYAFYDFYDTCIVVKNNISELKC